ncbi:clasp N terminal-domain-containing protein [Gigaspora rosea]|uniref:Clasp N terminal-domain-containing protein n=1 Tax=Gigaspora rosea TaxID=44941 RepID=A0A397UW25_9GLOM|nr:clasp N terminal-domain-containing protein [Gigaspora rosea]
MTEVVDKVLAALKGNNLDKKIEALAKLEEELIEETPLEPQEITQLVPTLRDALKGSQIALSYASLTCLNPFVSLIAETHPSQLKNVIVAFAPSVIDKLGDTKDKTRDHALQVLLTMYESATNMNGGTNIVTVLSTIIKDTAFGHKHWRVREQILQWVAVCSKKISDFPIRQWVPYMVKLLEDPHEQVREAAKDTIVLLFNGAASHAKSDLKRELKEQSIRPGIVDYILSKIISSPSSDGHSDRYNVVYDNADNHTDAGTEITEEDYFSSGTGNEETAKSTDSIVRPTSSADSEIGVINVDSAKELEREFQNLLSSFQGRESEQNWLARERGINRLRSLTRGDSFTNFQEQFINGLKLLMDGILKSLSSLRTTLTLASAGLIRDLATHLGSAIDPFAENLLVNLIKMTSSAKKIVAQAAANSANALLKHASYHARLVTQIWHAMEEKNMQIRSFAIGFVKTVIQSHCDRKDAMERTGGAESLEKCVRKGLTDANSKVRETCRDVFWTFYEVWPERGEKIMRNLEPAVKKQLERDRPKTLVVVSSPLTTPPKQHRPTTPAPPTRRARSPSVGKSKGPPTTGYILEDNHSLQSESPSKSVKEPSKLTPHNISQLRPKSPAPPMARTKSAASNSSNSSNLLSPKLTPTKRGSSNQAPSTPKTPPASKTSSTPKAPRKPTIIEQLEHSEWPTRIEGLLVVAQLIVKRSLEPSSAKQLPPDEVLSSVLINFLNDPDPKVIEKFMDPNIFVELSKVIQLEHFIPKLILSASDESKPEQSQIIQSHLPGLKSGIGSNKALASLNKCLLLLSGSGTGQKKLASGFSQVQKRKIINGILIWLNEIIVPKLEEVENSGTPNGYLGDVDKYKLLANRLIPMVSMVKDTSENFKPLSDLLINMHKLNPDLFETVLFTFDNKIIDAVGNVVGWEEELEEAVEEVTEEERERLLEEQRRQEEEQKMLLEQEELQKRKYEEQMIEQQQLQLRQLQQQKQEQLEKQKRERELKQQRERERELELQKQREIEQQRERERELELQKQREAEQREREIRQQRERERELELRERREIEKREREREQREYERKLQEQYQREQQEQLERQKRENELKLREQLEKRERERELELLKQKQQQREYEIQQQREYEIQQQREYEIQQQREYEIQQQREYEIQQQREYEMQQQREYELQQQREYEMQQQREYNIGMEKQRPPQLSLTSQKTPRPSLPSRQNSYSSNINDWVENQRSPLIQADSPRSSKDASEEEWMRRNRPTTAEPQLLDPRVREYDRSKDASEEEWMRRNRPTTAEPHLLDPRVREYDRHRRSKTPTRGGEYERRRDNGNWEDKRISRSYDMFDGRDSRYDINDRNRRRDLEWNDRGRHYAKDNDVNDMWSRDSVSTDKEHLSEGHEEEYDSVSEFELNQPDNKEKRSMNKPVGRVVSLPPPPQDFGVSDLEFRDSEIANLKELVEKLDMEENVLNGENATDTALSRPASIFISEDTLKHLSNTLTGNVNPFFLNPEERFNNGDEQTLTTIQEVETSEMHYPPEKSPSQKNPIINNNGVLSHSEQIPENVQAFPTNAENINGSINSQILQPIEEINGTRSTEQQTQSPTSAARKEGALPGARDRALKRSEFMQAGPPLPASVQERRLLLATHLARLNNHDVDISLFRKLARLSKETLLSDRETTSDIWENGDRFSELLTALIGFLSDSEATELRENAVMLLGQLLTNQPDYVRGSERIVLRILLECSSDPSANVCGQAEEILENFTQEVDCKVGLYALIDIMESTLFGNSLGVSSPSGDNMSSSSRAAMKKYAFTALSLLVKRFDKKSLERQIGRIIPLAIKGFNDQKSEIRKAVVDTLVVVYSVLGDDNTLFQYLGSLNHSQKSLLSYYFDKSRKQQTHQRHGVLGHS